MSPSKTAVDATADDDLYLQEMEAVAFSCNRRAVTEIRACLKSQPFTFVEYLAMEPVVIDSAATIDNTTFFFPFLRREAERVQWHKISPSTPIVHDDSFWTEQAKKLADYQYPGSIDILEGNNFAQLSWALRTKTKDKYDVYPIPSAEIRRSELRSGVRDHDGAKLEYNLFGRAVADAGLSLRTYYTPIASERLFYGYALLLFPVIDPGVTIETKGPDKIGDVFAKTVSQIHLQTLPFFHETIYELKHETNPGAAETTFQRVRQHPQSSNVGRIEDAFADLWERRKNCNATDGDEDDPATESLIFSRYYLASPKMVESVTDAISRCQLLRKPNKTKSLPSAMVYGAPGTGKEKLARLLAYLSEDYFGKRINTINMAAIRPSSVAAPYLQGMELDICHIPSVFVPKDADAGNKRPQETFILDELNSLDIENQGILLRIIEQGEVTPMFGQQPQLIAHLIIGVVNEDPEQITRESELEEVVRASGALGTIATALLSDTLRRSRRLRDDLFHRLRRGVYVRIPSINERREDLPFLLLRMVKSEIKAQWKAETELSAEKSEKKQEPSVYIDFRAYDVICDGSINWRGNVRRVERFARRVARQAYDDRKEKDEYYVHRDLVHKCLVKEFEKEIPDIADRLSLFA